MMVLGGTRRALGVAVGDRSMLVAEVAASGGRRRLVRCAEFSYAGDTAMDKPQALGAALSRFLKQERFSVRRAVVGLPGKWLLVKPKSLPPADEAAVVNMLQLQAEREFAADAREWVFDFAGQPVAGAARPVLLVATPRQRLEDLTAALANAGLRVTVATSSAMALATAGDNRNGQVRATLYVSPDGAELALRVAGHLVISQHLAVDLPAANGRHEAPGAPAGVDGFAPLAGEIRRVLSLLPSDQSGGQPQTLAVWDGVGLSGKSWTALGQRLSLPVEAHLGAEALGVELSQGMRAEHADRFAAATALALAGLASDRAPVDFLHSRLAIRRRQLLTRTRLWIGALAAVLVVAAGILAWDWHSQQQAVSDLRGQLAGWKKDLEQNRANVDRVRFARGWYDTRPPYLGCLRALAGVFPNDGIWTTSLAVRDDLSGTLSGKAQEYKTVLEVLNRLQASKSFHDAKLSYWREADRRSRTGAFAITFVYVAKE